MSKIANVALAAAALLTVGLHWMPLGHPLIAWALGCWVTGLLLSSSGARWPLMGITAVYVMSCWWNDTPIGLFVLQSGPMLGVALLMLSLSRPSIRRALLWTCAGAGILALHALLCFWAFRAIGGAHRVRPPLSVPELRWLVWPYYETHYDTGAHLVGVFLNDNLFGVWAVAFFSMCVVLAPQQPRPVRRLLQVCAGLLFLAAVWTYSRSAMVAALGVLVYLAVRWSPRVLLVLLLVPLLYLSYATWLDRYRFLDPTSEVVYPAWRIEQARRAFRTLASGSLLGRGPGVAGLVDSQWVKIPLELGWLGVLAYGWLIARMLRPSSASPGLQAAILALWLGGIGTDFLESPHLAATLAFFWGCKEATLKPDGASLPDSGSR